MEPRPVGPGPHVSVSQLPPAASAGWAPSSSLSNLALYSASLLLSPRPSSQHICLSPPLSLALLSAPPAPSPSLPPEPRSLSRLLLLHPPPSMSTLLSTPPFPSLLDPALGSLISLLRL
eukprot:1634312-Rhodomonas_salina.1